MTLGARIKEQREALGYSQEELAHKLGYRSRSTINKIEMGINDINSSKLLDFAKILNTTPMYLLGVENCSIQKEITKILTRLNENTTYFKIAKLLYELNENQLETLISTIASLDTKKE